ncbi:DUF3618 domain-containing protein [Aureimonas altamirensis]|uniref:DUF3618 domain-containing protein n=1 Tax=Aureimonas altamirensis TaxID=370622 RepID=UPI0025549532|nr:DUF3618 domain-containing protein [Aureimonas altamirensis]
MSTDTERLAREAEQHRSQVDSTLDQLKDRFSVGQIVDELSRYVQQGQASEMVKNLNRQVRDNPLALGLVGAGIAWLLVGQGVRDESSKLKGRYNDWRDDDASFDRDRTSGGGYPIADDRPHTVGSGPYAGPAGSSQDSGPSVPDRARGAASSVSDATSSAVGGVSGAASSAASNIAGAARSAGSGVSGAAQNAGATLSTAANAASDGVSRALHDAQDVAYNAGERAASYGRRAQRSFLDTLQEEPLIVGAVALAIGAAVGAALPATRREDQLFGGARDRLRDDAISYGHDALDKAGHAASEAYKAGSEEADRKGLKPEGGETLAQKVSAVAGKAAEAAKDHAKKEGLV